MTYIYEGAFKSSQKGDNMTKRTGQNAVIADEQIIELYWQREEKAIQETDKKYGQFLYRIAYNIIHKHKKNLSLNSESVK